MAFQYHAVVQNAQLNAVESSIGTGPRLYIWGGAAMPSACSVADSGTSLVGMDLPSDWMAASSASSVGLTGSWQTRARSDGTARYFRIYQLSTGSCVVQGNCTDSGGAGPLLLSSSTITSGDTVTISAFTIVAGNA